jgi:hypothetical protein
VNDAAGVTMPADFYTPLVARALGIDPEEVTVEQCNKAKNIIFRSMYTWIPEEIRDWSKDTYAALIGGCNDECLEDFRYILDFLRVYGTYDAKDVFVEVLKERWDDERS